MRRAGRRADEEQFLRVRRLEQFLAFGFFAAFDGRVFAKVDAGAEAALVKYGLGAF